ncbi:MAG: hypothetical protein COB67_00975 [SAR324 cluster bacterium]|uniref:Uncharacterized protein n=1 Tax=SAR324 cluster bacterium TaxID=2024889 RepID=A0A2A4TBJ8_9DELT|nr:MAG: hypothetical protein COB67_00975 [SAR324 cluster bacterium]
MNWKMNMKKLLNFWLLLLCLGTTNGYGQVVSPSLDPTQNVIMPAASGWRKIASIGVEYLEQSGVREQNQANIYDFDATGYSADIAFNISNFFFEGSVKSLSTATKQPLNNQGTVNLESTEVRGNFVLFGDDFVSIGLGIHSTVTKDYISSTLQELDTTRTGTIGSLSIAMGDYLKVGGAVERVKEASSHKVDNNWTELTAALALNAGEVGKVQFRMEFSLTTAPESEKQATLNQLANEQPGTLTTRGDIEIMFSGLLFAYRTRSIEFTEQNQDVKKIRNQMGVLWVPPSGLVLGFYFTSDSIVREYEDTFTDFSVRLGHVF